MIRRIIHISDIHIRTFKRHQEYQEASISLFNNIKEQISGYDREEVRIVIVGDVVHQKITISNEQIEFVSWFLKRCSKLAPVILVAGNHDLLENNKDRMDSLTPIISLMDNTDIKYLKDKDCFEDDNIVWCNYSIFHDNERPDIEKAREQHKDKKFIGLFHGPINGFSTDLGYQFTDSQTLEIFNGCDAVLCGDIHKRFCLYYENNDKKIPIAMAGSCIQQSYGETVTNHGYLLWDVDTLTYKECNIETEYGFYNFKISSIKDIEDNNEVLLNL